MEGVSSTVVLDGLARWLPVTLLEEGVHAGVLVQWLHVTLLEGVQAVVLLPLLAMLLVPLQALLEALLVLLPNSRGAPCGVPRTFGGRLCTNCTCQDISMT